MKPSSTNQKPRILFLGTQMTLAGAQQVLLAQARCFHEKDYPVLVVFFYDKEGLGTAWQNEYPFPIHDLSAWKYAAPILTNIFRLLPAFFRLFKLLKTDVQILESFTPDSNLIGIPLAWLAGVRVRIATHHGDRGFPYKLHGWMVNSRLTSILVAVSAQVRELVIEKEKVDTKKVVVIENGIDPHADQPLTAAQKRALRADLAVPKGAFLFLIVGRLIAVKGHALLLDSIARISADFPKTIFAFAGDGPLRKELEMRAAELGIAEQVRFLGQRRDVAQLLSVADAYLQPSLSEGLSIAMLEALMASVPVIATRAGGTVDLIEDERTGLLVERADIGALSAAIKRILGDADLRDRLGRAGQDHAREHYSLEKMCTRYESLMLKLLGAGGGVE